MSNTSTSNQSSGTGIGLAGAVFLVFLTLKLTGYIDWSWWWVTAPLWGGVVLLLLLLGGLAIAALISVARSDR